MDIPTTNDTRVTFLTHLTLELFRNLWFCCGHEKCDSDCLRQQFNAQFRGAILTLGFTRRVWDVGGLKPLTYDIWFDDIWNCIKIENPKLRYERLQKLFQFYIDANVDYSSE